jgi:lipoprotein-anchoring transpeptidase ErfK/SrfK
MPTSTPSPQSLLQGLILAVAILCLPSCGTPEPGKPFADDPSVQVGDQNKKAADSGESYSYWDDDGGGGRLRVTIDLSEQTAYFYRGDRKVGRSRVATGLPGRSTPRGSFSIIEKKADKRSNLYGVMVNSSGEVVNHDADSRRHKVPPGGRFDGAPMPYWMRLTTAGVGMHHGPIPNPGSRASHGCIRMPQSMAQALFNNAPLGTPVKIVD